MRGLFIVLCVGLAVASAVASEVPDLQAALGRYRAAQNGKHVDPGAVAADLCGHLVGAWKRSAMLALATWDRAEPGEDREQLILAAVTAWSHVQADENLDNSMPRSMQLDLLEGICTRFDGVPVAKRLDRSMPVSIQVEVLKEIRAQHSVILGHLEAAWATTEAQCRRVVADGVQGTTRIDAKPGLQNTVLC